MASKDFIFDELAIAKKLIAAHKIDDTNAFNYIRTLAKYNYYINEYDDVTNYRNIVEYMSKYWSMFSEQDYYKAIDNCIKGAKKYPYRKMNNIAIRKSELDFIKSLDSIRLEKMAFVLLCIAKYEHYYSESPTYWANISASKLSSLARVHVPPQKQLELLYQLKEKGAIDATYKTGSASKKVLFVSEDENDPVVLELCENDYKELAYLYLYYKNGFSGYVNCSRCGRLIPKKANKTTYCSECAKRNIEDSKKKYRVENCEK